MTVDLAQRIRERLDELAAAPTGLIEVPETFTEEQLAKFRRAFEARLGSRVWFKRKHEVVPLPDTAPEVMRAALLAVLDAAGDDDEDEWVAHCIAKALGIEARDDV